MKEDNLIDKAKQGDKEALNILLKDNISVLKGYVIKITGDMELSKDIVQDTMLKAVINIEKFEPRAKFSTWLIKIATNIYRDYLRKNKITELVDENMEDKNQRLEEMVLTSFQYKEAMKIIKRLSPEKRLVFVLKHYYGYKYEEIAKMVNCPVGTVRSRLHNSIKFIIEEFKREEML